MKRNRNSAKGEGQTEGVEGEEESTEETAEELSPGEDYTLDDTDEPPVGMVRRNANDAAGWVAKFAGHVVYGQLLGRFAKAADESTGEIRHFYQVKLLRPCKVALRADDQTEDEKVKTAKKGEIVNLDENKGLEGLQEAITEGGIQIAWVKFKGKKRQQRDPRKTFWDVDAYSQKRNAPF